MRRMDKKFFFLPQGRKVIDDSYFGLLNCYILQSGRCIATLQITLKMKAVYSSETEVPTPDYTVSQDRRTKPVSSQI
jgi:hypothetical protein